MIILDKNIAVRNTEKVVASMNFESRNYIYIDDKLITQQILIYSIDKIVTFYVKITRKNDLHKFCYRPFKFLNIKSILYDLFESRTEINEYNISTFEDIALIDNDTKLYFMNDYGPHYFKIAETDIYGFNQDEQIKRFKKFVDKVYARINTDNQKM